MFGEYGSAERQAEFGSLGEKSKGYVLTYCHTVANMMDYARTARQVRMATPEPEGGFTCTMCYADRLVDCRCPESLAAANRGLGSPEGQLTA